VDRPGITRVCGEGRPGKPRGALGNYPARTGFVPHADIGDLMGMLQRLRGAKANDASWAHFKRKYVLYPRFKEEYRVSRRTYHTHVWDKQTLKEKCLGPEVKNVVGDIEEMTEVWNMLKTASIGPRSTSWKPWIP
jgi:hypothetical protein